TAIRSAVFAVRLLAAFWTIHHALPRHLNVPKLIHCLYLFSNAGKRFLGCVLGSRGVATGEKLWQTLAPMAGEVMTDYWQPYESFVPAGQHTQSKAETFTVEGYNSLFRHFLARLRRKSKCYSKCQKMLEYSVRLLMAKRNNEIIYS
ncbi:IS1 family transposase, partial [Candidatus Methylobacter favarea]|uniref:IS1 family transposase n=1 Tax=Candidatus Methylobacter favarea TaxID=2707345 RepID=UPI00157CFFF0